MVGPRGRTARWRRSPPSRGRAGRRRRPRLSRFNGMSVVRIPGPAGARQQFGRGDGPRSSSWRRRSRAPASPGPACPIRNGCRRGRRRLLYALSLLVVFLCLAALYESWSIPVAVLLVVPLGLVGAVFAVTLRGLENDVYLQIGLLTTMGLAAKNAILMIEFAEQAEKQGQARDRRRARGRAHPAAPDPDDQLRLHLRRAAAGDLDRRRRQQPHRHRHGGDRRHADRDHPRDLLHPAVLRARPPRRARRHRRAACASVGRQGTDARGEPA